MKKIFQLILSIAALVAAMSFIADKKTEKNKLIIQFENYVGNDKLELDSAIYKNELKQSFTVSKFKYYVSNIHLKNKTGKEFISNGYFLVNEEDDSSKQIMLSNIPEGDYTSISFTLGVDSLHNCSGIQTGALDPLNGMFWAWNTGYVFLKLEGNSAQSKSPGNIFEYHIGGYKQPTNCIRTIELKLESVKISSIRIKTDVSEILKIPTTIDFSKLSSVTDFHNAVMMADNYSDMFSLSGVK